MWEKTQELYKLRTSVNAVLVEFTEENRVFENGHVVLVCRRSDDSIIGQGIVTSARTFVGSNGRIDELELKRYAEQEGELNADMNIIRYEVYARKSNGEISTKHFFQAPHFLSEKGTDMKYNDYYIKTSMMNNNEWVSKNPWPDLLEFGEWESLPMWMQRVEVEYKNGETNDNVWFGGKKFKSKYGVQVHNFVRWRPYTDADGKFEFHPEMSMLQPDGDVIKLVTRIQNLMDGQQ